MSLFEILILSAIVIGFLAIALILFHTKRNTQFSQLHNPEVKKISEEKKELEGKIQEITRQNEKYEDGLKSKDRLLDDRNKQINDLQNTLKDKEKQLTEGIEKLNSSRQDFQEERERVKQDEKERQKKEKENLNRIWNEHEVRTLKSMEETCKKKDINLSYYSNTNPDPDFPENIRPDFVVKIIDQYVIFDAKLSKSSNINNYIKNQVKNTAKKYKANGKIIFPFIFFVIPTISTSDIKKTHFHEEIFHFYVITVEAFEPIIRTLKKLEDYDFAKDIDPENREKIVESIAGLRHGIKQQNAMNILGAGYGLKALDKVESLPEDVLEDVVGKEANMSFETFSIPKVKELGGSAEKQKKILIDLLTPQKPAIKLDDITIAEKNDKKA